MDRPWWSLKHPTRECKHRCTDSSLHAPPAPPSSSSSPTFSFQQCIPEDESADTNTGASNAETIVSSSSNSVDIPTRRILRRHEKNSNHDHLSRNGLNDDHFNSHGSSTGKHQHLTKPYSERMNHYAETRARIFNETPNASMDPSNSSAMNRTTKVNPKQQPNFPRPSYRKQQQQQQQHQNSSHQHRSFNYQHAQQTANTHMQQYSTGKPMDPSSHMLNSSTSRSRHRLTPQIVTVRVGVDRRVLPTCEQCTAIDRSSCGVVFLS